MASGRNQAGQRAVLEGFGRTARSSAGVLVAAVASDVTAALTDAPRRGVLARGLGRSYGDAALNAGGLVVDLTRLTGITALDEDQGMLRARAGTSLAQILDVVVPRGWFVPVTPGTRWVTLGGALAADVHGKNHHRDGSFATHVLAFDLVTPAGTRTVTPEKDADVFWATAGGMGLTGVVTELTLRLLPIRTSRVVVTTERAPDLDGLLERMTADDQRYRYSVAWLDAMARGRHLGRGVLSRGDHAAPDELAATDRRDRLAYRPTPSASMPPVPRRVLSPGLVRTFNEALFRSTRDRDGEVQSLTRFFHPLDAIEGWNRAYGPRGFIQYQFVVPFGHEDLLHDVLESLTRSGNPAFLAVLKQFGPANPGPLSFPLAGWTLALDLPAGRPGIRRLLSRFDDRVAGAGGRVYLAKDACLRPEMISMMYPAVGQWRGVRDQLDPEGRLASDLSRRLGLVGADLASVATAVMS